MSSNKIFVTISIDGSAIGNGTPNATAGYAMVVELNDSVAEFKSVLCPGCDRGLQTNNRAELRAAQSALNFLQELGKKGYYKYCQVVPCLRSTNHLQDDYNYVSDDRSIDASQIVGIIHTDSTFVQKGATRVNRQMRHRDLWENINTTMDCLTRDGMEIRFKHIRGHSGDWGNERADELAGEMARTDYDSEEEEHPSAACCVTCDADFDSLADLAVHYKRVHLGRDLRWESVVEAMYDGDTSGNYECTFCDRVLGSRFAMKQHLRDKHGYYLA